MRMGKIIVTTAGLCYMATASMAFGLGIGLGPFQLDLDAGWVDGGQVDPVIVQRRMITFDEPICYAIQRRKLLEIIVEWKERISDKETKRTIKQVTVEPYLFGTDKNGRPVLRGNIVSENVLKQVTVKYGQDDQTNDDAKKQGKDQSWSGLFHPTDKNGGSDLATINIDRLTQIRVIEQSNFKPPTDFNKIFKGAGVVNVLCTISSTE